MESWRWMTSSSCRSSAARWATVRLFPPVNRVCRHFEIHRARSGLFAPSPRRASFPYFEGPAKRRQVCVAQVHCQLSQVHIGVFQVLASQALAVYLQPLTKTGVLGFQAALQASRMAAKHPGDGFQIAFTGWEQGCDAPVYL